MQSNFYKSKKVILILSSNPEQKIFYGNVKWSDQVLNDMT
jgi:hypothetical protein